MRKFLIIILLSVLSLTLVGCRDQQIDDDTFNVIFYVGQQSSYVDSYFDVPENSTIEEPVDPTRDGFMFSGWYKDITLTNPWVFETDTVTGSIVLYAKWVAEIWNISFQLNSELGETYVDPNTVPSQFDLNTNIYLPLVRRPGGSFKGWILVPTDQYTLDMTLYRYTNELPILEYTEFVLYPVFNNNKYLIQFSPHMEGVATPTPKPGVEYGSLINWVPVIQDTSTHTFVGWFTKNGTNTGDWGTQIQNGDHWAVAANALLHGRWEAK